MHLPNPSPEKAITLIHNADIICMDKERSTVDSIAYCDDIIIDIGKEKDIRKNLQQSNLSIEEIDAQGACILPGFIDPHLHPMLMSAYEHSIDLTGIDSLTKVEQLVIAGEKSVTGDEWLLGLQLDEQLLDIPRLPTREILDSFSPNRPLVIFKRDGHSITVNSKAIECAGISEQIPTITGGTIEVDKDGFPSGIFREKAVGLIMEHFVGPNQDQLLKGALQAFQKLTAQGITSIGAMLQTDNEGPGGASSSHEMLAMNALAEYCPFSIYSILIGKNVPSLDRIRNTPLHAPELGRKTQAFKIFSDGTLGSCTACMHDGFFDRPEKSGYLTLSPDEIYRRMVSAHQQGWQICVHAIGDKAIDTCIDLYEKLLKNHPKEDHRHRIEHASIVSSEAIRRIADLSIALCCQPLFIRSEKHWLSQRLGPTRSPRAYPFKSFFKAGIVISGSSDAPIENTDVLAAIECCVTRDEFEPDQCLDVDQALSMYTCNAAFIQFEEQEKGSLEIGKRADMVFLDRNPHKVNPGDIGNITVLKTLCGGKQTFYRSQTN